MCFLVCTQVRRLYWSHRRTPASRRERRTPTVRSLYQAPGLALAATQSITLWRQNSLSYTFRHRLSRNPMIEMLCCVTLINPIIIISYSYSCCTYALYNWLTICISCFNHCLTYALNQSHLVILHNIVSLCLYECASWVCIPSLVRYHSLSSMQQACICILRHRLLFLEYTYA